MHCPREPLAELHGSQHTRMDRTFPYSERVRWTLVWAESQGILAYMVKQFGNSDRPYAKSKSGSQLFSGKRGVIGFKKVAFAHNSATGHFTLWNGTRLFYGGADHDYFAIWGEAGLWVAPNVLSNVESEISKLRLPFF